MPTLDEIRAAIKAKIESVADAGKVHDYERFADKLNDLKTLYIAGDGKLRGWHVRRFSTRETSAAIGTYVVTHRWQIRALQAIEDGDASEKAFDTRIEALRTAVRDDEGLGRTDLTTVLDDGTAGIQVDDSGPAMFAGVLCHFARLTLYTRHQQ